MLCLDDVMNIWIGGSLPGLLFGLCILGLPAMTIWGWVRWFKQRDFKRFCSFISLFAFACGTLSGLLALFSVVYIQSVQLTAYDIRWARLLRIGLLISASAVILSLFGIWRRSSLRWHAPSCAVGMLFVWVIMAVMD
jgi:hypothetical protein